MSSIFALPPLLFLPLREAFGLSFTQLGSLVLVNFFTQLSIDLIFTVFSKHFNVKKVVRVMPLITSLGLVTYALLPTFFSRFAYFGLVLGTVIFSVSAGLSEVLLSPVIAALPSDNPSKDMSMLHSLYAFGVFTVVVISTLFLKLFGSENWMILTLFWAVLPVIAAVMFMTSPIPKMGDASEKSSVKTRNTLSLALCTLTIFFGSCAENVMSNWISSFTETALGLDKALGDILGMAGFAILLGITRITYAKYGKNIFKMLLTGMSCAAVCYIVVSLSPSTVVSFIACVLTGIFTSMLWPGTLIMMEENIPGASVGAFALMAAGGDLGASLAPQFLGIVVDKVSASDFAVTFGARYDLSPEQVGMKAGMLTSAVFPIVGSILLIFIIRYFKRKKEMQ